MTTLADFLELLFDEGRAAFAAPPTSSPDEREPAVAALQRAFAAYRLDVAGPLLPFDADTAFAAASFVRLACWFLVNRDAPAEILEQLLVVPAEAKSTEQHLAVDLTFRYLPQLHRRARALGADDPLTRRVEEALRRWPLSGVLADVVAGPTTATDFAGHPGLQLLYAERFVRNGRPEWRPVGRAAEYADLVRAERGG